MKKIDKLTASSVPDGWICQKGHPEKLLLSMKIFCESKSFQRKSAEGAKPDQLRKQIRLENRKQKLQEFADGRNDIHREELAKKQKVSRQKSNSSAVESNSIHCVSVSMAKNTNSDVLKDLMAVFVQGKDFFSDEPQKQIAANLGQSLLAQTNVNALHTSQEIAGPVELLDSDSESEEVEVVTPPATALESEAAAPAAAPEEEESSTATITTNELGVT